MRIKPFLLTKVRIIVFLTIIVIIGGLLRFSAITTDPPGLYIDEISIGLNAYDILHTGKDQYGYSYPLTFKSLGDYKMPVYIYLASLSMSLFGKTEFAIRFPSALAGTLTIIVVFFLTKELIENDKKMKKHASILALLSAGILAILPWHIQFSRGGFEVTVALFFYSIGLLLSLIFFKKNKLQYALFAVMTFALTMYTYHTYRLLSPLTVFIELLYSIKNKKYMKNMILAFVLFYILAYPIISYSLTPVGQTRLQQTSAFVSNPYPQGTENNLADGIIFITNYLSFFSLSYLFYTGDQINRHQIANFGLLYLWQLPFIFAGIYFVIKKIQSNFLRFSIFILLFIAPIPAAFAVPSPHTLRFLLSSIPFSILTSFGLYYIFTLKKPWKKFIIGLTIFFVLAEFCYFVDYYFIHYPKTALIDWGGECKEVVYDIQKESNRYNHIVVDRNIDCIPEYFMFYIPTTHIVYADPDWREPSSWKNKPVLYVRPFYGNKHPDHLMYNVYLPNINHDIFAQFIKL
ncbi:MAG TPA: glycosyltransferase family 39 protein [Candidatus Saccharimonadales bacterium]|nr:glycosyltransferase family 39 protein [Candidatus Saccharimonadales bacterium]